MLNCRAASFGCLRHINSGTRGLRHREIHCLPCSEPFRVLFLGRDEFSVLVFKELHSARDVWQSVSVVTYPDQKVGRRGSHVRESPLRLHIEAEQLDVRLGEINTEKSWFKTWQPPHPFVSDCAEPSHLLVTASFGRILPNHVLRTFAPSRRLNVHPSLLPAYRGPAPIQHAMINGEKKTGVCVTEMLEWKKGVDAGDIWGFEEVELNPAERFESVRDVLATRGGKLLVDVLRDMLAGSAKSTPQLSDSRAPKAPLITRATTTVDFTTMSSQDILRRHFAIASHRGLITFLPNFKSVQLGTPSIFETSASSYVPQLPLREGAFTYHPSSDKILVRCARHTILSVTDMKGEGKGWTGAKDWWNGVKGSSWWEDCEARFRTAADVEIATQKGMTPR